MWEVYTRLNFVVTLVIAEVILCAKFQRRKYFWIFLAAGVAVASFFGWFWPDWVAVNGPETLWVRALNFLVVFVVSFGMLFGCYKSDGWSLLFVATLSYCLQHIAYQAHSIIVTNSGGMPRWGQALTLAICCAAVYAPSCFIFLRKIPEGGPVRINNKFLMTLNVIIIATAVFVSFYGEVYSSKLGSELLLTVVCLFSIIGCLVSVLMCGLLMSMKEQEAELAVLQHIVHSARRQYEETEDSINVINIKCHDLRHQLAALKDRVDEEEIEKISTAIDIYDSSFDTGNKALDVVLAEKSLACRKLNVRLTCAADGSALNAWKPGDVYSFFGNAIENALNGVAALDEESRIVSISGIVRDGYANICVENYYTGKLMFKDGLPATARDTRYHGFGMKSMKLIAEKYGGGISVEADGGIFRLKLFVPIKQ